MIKEVKNCMMHYNDIVVVTGLMHMQELKRRLSKSKEYVPPPISVSVDADVNCISASDL